MTYEELSKYYPSVCNEFDSFFHSEGYGANCGSQLDENGFNEWYSDFIRDYGIDSLYDYEKELNDYGK